MKNNPYVLTNIEKSRHKLIGQFFSSGASIELQKKIVNERFDVVKKQIESISKDREDKKQNKQKNDNFKKNVLKFSIVGGLVVSLGYFCIKKLNDVYEEFEMIQDVPPTPTNHQDKLYHAIDEQKDLLEKEYVEPLKTNFLSMLGVKGYYQNLYNKSYNKYIGGPFGVILPNFVLLSIIYIFRKLGHGWFLEIMDIKNPQNHDMVLSMWEHFARNKVSYYTSGNQSPGKAELGNASQVQSGWIEYKNKFQQAMDYFYEGQWFRDEVDWVDNNLSQIVSKMEEVSKRNQTLLGDGFKMDSIIQLSMTGRHFDDEIYTFENGRWDNDDSPFGDLSVEEMNNRRKDPTRYRVIDQGENKVKIRRITSSVYNMEHTSFKEMLEDKENQYDGWKAKNKIIETPNDFLWVNDMSRKMISIVNNNKNFESFKPILNSWNRFYVGRDDDGSWWTPARLTVMMQIFVYASQWLALQQLQSQEGALAMYNETLQDKMSDIYLGKLIEVAKLQQNKPEPWELDFIRGKITFEELFTMYFGVRDKNNNLISKGKIHELFDKGFLSKVISNKLEINSTILKANIFKAQKKIKNLAIKNKIQTIQNNVKQMVARTKNHRSVSSINTQQLFGTLRPNFNKLKAKSNYTFENWDKNGKVKLFDCQLIKGSDQTIYSGDQRVQTIFNQSPYSYQLLWKKEGSSGHPPSNQDEDYQWGWYRINGRQFKTYVHGLDDGDGVWGYAKFDSDVNPMEDVSKPSWAGHYWKIFVNNLPDNKEGRFKYFLLEADIGSTRKEAYEYMGEDGEIGVVYVDIYRQYFSDFRRIVYKDEKSSYSDAAKFQTELSEQLTGLTAEQKIQLITEYCDVFEVEKQRLLKERYEIIDDILKNRDGDNLFFMDILK